MTDTSRNPVTCTQCGSARLLNLGMVGLLTYYSCNECGEVQGKSLDTYRTTVVMKPARHKSG
jgi:hypothetical protein